jgi:hypothetical protein
MAATRKRKSTRTPAKSKKAKAEEAVEEPVEETPADDPPADDAKEAPAAEEEEEAKIVQADSKDTHEAAEALLAVSGGDVGKSAAKNGEGE